MYLVNRYVAIIKPKQPFLDWLESQSDWDLNIALEEIRTDRGAYLIPSCDSPGQAMQYIERNYRTIFEWELYFWYTAKFIWPEKRTLSVFRKWFDVEIHTMVVDISKDRIEREEMKMELLE